MVKFTFFFALICWSLKLTAQMPRSFRSNDSSDITFSGTKINPYQAEYDTTGKVVFSGYVDAYYAHYSDSSSSEGYAKFPTCAPRNNQLGINILQISAKYNSRLFRGTITLFGGDCPKSSWSPHFIFIREANFGFRIVKKLWLDAGFFRTHFGLESIQPRENMTMSLATTTYFEPYFLSGAKLTWQQSEKLAIQVNAFNSFNQFLETNKNKAVGLSLAYTPSSKLTTSFSSIWCDESPENASIKRNRLYSNLCVVYKSTRMVVGLEGNFGFQQHSVMNNPSAMAFMCSSLLAFKYRITPKWASYIRGEVYSDPNEILTGPVVNANHQYVGIDLVGATGGVEFKPIPNSYVRFECRYLQTRSTEDIFYRNGAPTNKRLEFIAGIGLWF